MTIADLYGQLILDHHKHPRNKGSVPDATHQALGRNPVCGDAITLSLRVKDGVVSDIQFQGEGCAISQASSSLMTEVLMGKTRDEAEQLMGTMHELLTGEEEVAAGALPPKLLAFAHVKDFPSRVKCAALPWRTLESALKKEGTVTTEE